MVVRTTEHRGGEASLNGLRLTAEEYFALPDDGNRYELIDGVVVMSPSAGNSHQHVTLEIAVQLRSFVRSGGLGFALIDADVELPAAVGGADLVYRPDLHFVRSDRAGFLGDRTRIAPDVVVEVISPESRSRDSVTKFRDYESAGVSEYWLIDPLEARLQFFRLTDGKFVAAQFEPDTYVSLAVPGFRLDLTRLRETFRELN